MDASGVDNRGCSGGAVVPELARRPDHSNRVDSTTEVWRRQLLRLRTCTRGAPRRREWRHSTQTRVIIVAAHHRSTICTHMLVSPLSA
jgi:hypothetical protein